MNKNYKKKMKNKFLENLKYLEDKMVMNMHKVKKEKIKQGNIEN